MAPSEDPILFLWAFSPWASKVVAYLALRKITHARCEQPITQPRPDLEALGVKYRRIPLLGIGRDIYCDTLLILETLEKLYPPSSQNPQISATNPSDKALEKLFEKWTDMVVFKPAAAAIPTDMDLMKDEKFQKDREELWGRSWGKEAQDALRPKGLADLRADFDLLEELLGDGRQWLLGNEGPKLADIHGKSYLQTHLRERQTTASWFLIDCSLLDLRLAVPTPQRLRRKLLQQINIPQNHRLAGTILRSCQQSQGRCAHTSRA